MNGFRAVRSVPLKPESADRKSVRRETGPTIATGNQMSATETQDRGTPDYELPTTGRGFGFEPRGRISPFFDCTDAAGAHDYHRHLNSYMPYAYGDDKPAQYQALHQSATLVDVHSLHVIQIAGPDALPFADYVVTRDVSQMKPGRSSYVFCTDEAGQVLADPVMLILDSETVWLTVGTVALELWLRGIAVNSTLQVTVTTVAAPSVQVAGPKARSILQSLTDFDLASLRPFHNTRARLAGLDVVISTTGYSGEQSFEVYLIGAEPYPAGRELGKRLWSAIRDAGTPQGLREAPVLYDRAREAGFVTLSHTEGDNINALEFWRPGIVDLSGGDFIGKAALLAIRDSGGPPRRMVGLLAAPGERMTIGEWDMPIYDGDRVVGTTRRTHWSETLGRGIAIALIDREVADAGRQLTLPHGSGISVVEVTELPFVASK
jgi:glycine cleavage system aminomethyltransferase T